MTGRSEDLPPWEEDAFVQTVLRELPVPDHGPDFWDHLAGHLDEAVDAAVVESTAPRRLPTRAPAGPRATHPPRVAPLRATAAAGPPPTPLPASFSSEDRSETTQEAARKRPAAARPAARRAPEPAAVVVHRDLAVVPQALRRRSNAVLAVAAAAAAVVVLVAGATLVQQRSEGDSGDETELADASNSSFSIDGVAGADDPAAAAVIAWVKALGAGEADEAWDALGAESQDRYGDQAAFEDDLSALAEGFGAWSATTPDQIVVTPVTASDEGTLSVVTLVGTVEQEGASQARADAFPVRIIDGTARIEPFADAGAIDFMTPGPGDEADAHDEVVVEVPAGVDAPVIRIGQSGPVRCGEGAGSSLELVADGTRQRCTFAPDGEEPTGARVVTVAFTSTDGAAVSARSMRYNAA